MTKLNLCCGDNKIDGYVSVDVSARTSPNLIFDVSKQWPLENDSATEILMYHAIEHFREPEQDIIFFEAFRVLKQGGRLILSYPEFLKCAENYRTNFQGKRDFWRATIYGRGLDIWDTHKTLMDTPFFVDRLIKFGFDYVKSLSEPEEAHNTILVMQKARKVKTYEEVIASEFFGAA